MSDSVSRPSKFGRNRKAHSVKNAKPVKPAPEQSNQGGKPRKSKARFEGGTSVSIQTSVREPWSDTLREVTSLIAFAAVISATLGFAVSLLDYGISWATTGEWPTVDLIETMAGWLLGGVTLSLCATWITRPKNVAISAAGAGAAALTAIIASVTVFWTIPETFQVDISGERVLDITLARSSAIPENELDGWEFITLKFLDILPVIFGLIASAYVFRAISKMISSTT